MALQRKKKKSPLSHHYRYGLCILHAIFMFHVLPRTAYTVYDAQCRYLLNGFLFIECARTDVP